MQRPRGTLRKYPSTRTYDCENGLSGRSLHDYRESILLEIAVKRYGGGGEMIGEMERID